MALLSLLIDALLLSSPVLCSLVNVTIDDTLGDPTNGQQIVYSPAGAWNEGQDCPSCSAQPSSSDTFDGTWHDATYNPTGAGTDINNFPGQIIVASVTFTGNPLYAYSSN